MLAGNDLYNVGQMVRFHRKKAGLSRIELAMIAGVGKTIIFDIEHNKQSIRCTTLKRCSMPLTSAWSSTAH